MVRLYYLILFFLLTIHTSCAQTVTSTGVSVDNTISGDSLFAYFASVPGKYIAMEVDVLDNIYLLTSAYQLKKIGFSGDSVGVFNDVKRYGNPSFIDVSNPFKILVYYRNFSTAVILDRLLTERNTINFRKQGIFNVRTVTTSYDNNIWLFDEQDFKLKKISDEGKVLIESNDMRQLIDSVPSPSVIIDSENLVYLYDPLKGFYIFDYYGALKNNLPFLNWNSVTVSKKKLYGFDDKFLYSYNTVTSEMKQYSLPEFFKGRTSVRAMNGKVYTLSETGLMMYTVK